MQTVKFRFPTVEESLVASNYYDARLNLYKKEGVITKKQLLFYLNKYEIFTSDHQKELERIEGVPKIKYAKPFAGLNEEELAKEVEKTVAEIVCGVKSVNLLEFLTQKEEKKEKDPDVKRLTELTNLKDSYLKNTAESLAEKDRIYRLIQFCSYNGDSNKRVWENWNIFENERNKKFQILIVSLGGTFLSAIKQNKIRRIARHHVWRSKWISATKTGSTLFNGPVAEWDPNKTFLAYWSNFYDNVYQAYEAPEEFIIEDDELLDNWLAKKMREAKEKETKTGEQGDVGIFRTKVNSGKKK